MNNRQRNKILSEGLRPNDLQDMVHELFEIDAFRSKMGEDRDVCVLSFHVKDRNPAIDMMEFIEKGFDFVLDADVSAGENEKGEYTVFVELPRRPKLNEYIQKITDGIQRLTGIKEWYFRYHKDFDRKTLDEQNLTQTVPNSPMEYDGFLHKVQTESIKSFFNKTLMDDLTLDGNMITIHKPFNQKVKLRLVNDVTESTAGPELMDAASMSEVFWLTKVLGNYNIAKRGNSFTFENNGETYILQRGE